MTRILRSISRFESQKTEQKTGFQYAMEENQRHAPPAAHRTLGPAVHGKSGSEDRWLMPASQPSLIGEYPEIKKEKTSPSR